MTTTEDNRKRWRHAATEVQEGRGWIASTDYAKCICFLLDDIDTLLAENKRLRDALHLAQPILDDELQTMCGSFCPPCDEGEDFDYSELKEPELGWIRRTEAALDAVEAALKESA